MGRDTRTGKVMEDMILPALRQGGYQWEAAEMKYFGAFGGAV